MAGPFLQPDRPCFFQSLGEKTKNKNLSHGTRAIRWASVGLSFFCLWAVHTRSNRWRALIGSWVTPPKTGFIEIKRGGCRKHNNQPRKQWRQLWAPPVMASAAAIGPPRPFRSRARVERAMIDAPYHRRHENLAGVDVLPKNLPLRFLQNNSSSWAPPAMVSTAVYGPSAAVLLKGAR